MTVNLTGFRHPGAGDTWVSIPERCFDSAAEANAFIAGVDAVLADTIDDQGSIGQDYAFLVDGRFVAFEIRDLELWDNVTAALDDGTSLRAETELVLIERILREHPDVKSFVIDNPDHAEESMKE